MRPCYLVNATLLPGQLIKSIISQTTNVTDVHYTQNATDVHYTQNATDVHYTQNATDVH